MTKHHHHPPTQWALTLILFALLMAWLLGWTIADMLISNGYFGA